MHSTPDQCLASSNPELVVERRRFKMPNLLNWLAARVRGAFRAWRHSLFFAFWASVYFYLWLLARPGVRLVIHISDYVWVRWPWPGTRRRAIRLLKAAVRGISPRIADHYLSTLACPHRYVGTGSDAGPDAPTRPLLPLHSVSFNGCAWMLPFHVGVCSVLIEEGAVDASTKWLGSSGGALVAATAALGLDLDDQLRSCVAMGTHSSERHALGPFGLMSSYIGPQIDRSLPPDAHETARGRLYISVTEAPHRDGGLVGNVLLGDFATRRKLYDALMASCYIPFYYERPARPAGIFGPFRFDGGFSDNQPVLRDGKGRVLTTTVSPTPMAADISPGRLAAPNIEHLFPKGPARAMAVYDSGVAVARRYVKKLRDTQMAMHAQRRRNRRRPSKGDATE